MVYVIQICWQLASRIRTELVPSWSWSQASSVLILLASCQQTCMTYTIAVCTVKNSWWCTVELPETCKFYSKNKFEKLVHLVGFIIKIYHDARSPERQIGLLVRYLLFLSDFNDTWIFCTDFRKIFKFQISLKSRRWEPSCCMRADRHNRAEIRFSQFC